MDDQPNIKQPCPPVTESGAETTADAISKTVSDQTNIKQPVPLVTEVDTITPTGVDAVSKKVSDQSTFKQPGQPVTDATSNTLYHQTTIKHLGAPVTAADAISKKVYNQSTIKQEDPPVTEAGTVTPTDATSNTMSDQSTIKQPARPVTEADEAKTTDATANTVSHQKTIKQPAPPATETDVVTSTEATSSTDFLESGNESHRAVTLDLDPGMPSAEIMKTKPEAERGALCKPKQMKSLGKKARRGTRQRADKPAESVYQNILDATKLLLDSRDQDKHVSTYAERTARRRLKSFSAVFITGRSGSGKSNLGLHLLAELSKNPKWKALYITSARQWDYIPKSSVHIKYVVMIDDIFGSSNLVQSQVDEWTRMFDIMWPSVESGHISLVITSRPEISDQYKDKMKKYKLMKNIQWVALDAGEFALRVSEKEKLLKKICGQMDDLTQREIDMIVQTKTSLGFPQCCEIFANNKQAQKMGLALFRQPHEYLQEALSSLKENDVLSYFVLVLVMANERCLDHRLFKLSEGDTSKLTRLVNDLSENLGLSRPPDITQLKTKAESLNGVYLTTTKKGYIFQHLSLFDALIYNMAKDCPEFCIRMCPTNMLLSAVQTKGKTEEDYTSICLTPDNYYLLADRIIDLLSTHDMEILEHPSLRDKRFLHHITSRWKGFPHDARVNPVVTVDISTSVKATSEQTNTCYFERNVYSLLECDNLLAVIVLKCQPLAESLMKKVLSHSEIALSSQVLACCIYTGKSKLVEKLLAKGVPVDVTCFRALCGSQDLEDSVTETLLNKLDVHWSELADREELLCLAAVRGNTTVMKLLLGQIGSNREITVFECLKIICNDILHIDEFVKRNLSDSRLTRYETVMHMLLNCLQNSDTVTNEDKYSILEICAKHAYAVGVREMMFRNWKLTNKQLEVCLHNALATGGAGCVQELFKHPQDEHWSQSKIAEFLGAAAGSVTDSREKVQMVLEYFSSITQPLNVQDDNTDMKATLNNEDFSFGFPIHRALMNSNTDAVKLLIEAGCDINILDASGMAPLHVAVGYRDPEAVKFLIQHAANVNIQNEAGLTPLHLAAGNADLECVKKLLEAGADANIRNNNSETCLLLAEKWEVIKILVSSGSDVNAKDRWCQTTLYKAAQRNDISTVKYLVLKGALIHNTVDHMNALHMAAKYADVEMLKYLYGNCDIRAAGPDDKGTSVLHAALKSQNDAFEKLQYLIDVQGVPYKGADSLGRTILHTVVTRWDQEVFEFLIRKGCDLHHKNKLDRTLLFTAVQFKQMEAAEFLIGKGLDLKHVDSGGKTLLHILCTSWPPDCLSWLRRFLNAGIDPHLCSHFKTTALLLAVTSYRPDQGYEVCQLLIERMTNVDQTDNDGQTALHLAVRYSHDRVVHLLLQKGADTTIKDNRGKIAEEYAFKKKLKRLFKTC